MELNYVEIGKNDYELFYKLLEDYYREGEDENTPSDIVETFILKLYKMIVEGELEGFYLKDEDKTIGFAIFMIDDASKEFSEFEGFGTITEIGLVKEYRNTHLGEGLVGFCEDKMKEKGITKFYITPYDKALSFWVKCGYKKTKKYSSNGMRVYTKEV